MLIIMKINISYIKTVSIYKTLKSRSNLSPDGLISVLLDALIVLSLA